MPGRIERAHASARWIGLVNLPPHAMGDTMTQPVWTLITSGDDFALYRDTTGAYEPEAEIWHAERDADDSPGRVYRFTIERCRLVTQSDGEPVGPHVTTRSPDAPAPDAHPEWFSRDLDAIAFSAGRSGDDLRAALCSDDPIERFHAYRDIVGYHPIENFDSYPLAMDQEDWDRRDRAGRFPRTAEIAAYLAALDRTPPFAWSRGTDEDGDPIPNPDMFEDGEPARMEVRLQVHANGSWSIHTGDSQYDTDHRGTWSNTSIPFTGDPEDPEFDARAVANELIDGLEFDGADGADD